MADETQSLREFLREELLLSRKAFDANMAEMAKLGARIEAGTAELREHTRRMNRDHEEFHAEVRASREAAFRLLDRYGDDSGGGTAPAT